MRPTVLAASLVAFLAAPSFASAGDAAPRTAGLLGCVNGDTLRPVAAYLSASAPSKDKTAYQDRYESLGWGDFREKKQSVLTFRAGSDGRNSIRLFDVPHGTVGAAAARVADCIDAG